MQPQPPTMQTDDQERDLRAALAARLALFEADECGFMRYEQPATFTDCAPSEDFQTAEFDDTQYKTNMRGS
jgi:hypothetical protein